MQDIFKPVKKIKKKVNHIIYTLVACGILLIILGFLIVWTDYVLKLVMGFSVIVVAFVFFYAAQKIWAIKKDVEKYFKI